MTRYDTIRDMVTSSGSRVVAEIGVDAGALAAELLKLPQIERYWMVDPWGRHALDRRAAALRVAEDPRVRVIERPSLDAAESFADGELDMAYIDAVHDYASVRDDILVWWPKVRRLLSGHDYVLYNTCVGCPCGVVPAVEELAARVQRPVLIDNKTHDTAAGRLLAAYEASRQRDPAAFPSWSVSK